MVLPSRPNGNFIILAAALAAAGLSGCALTPDAVEPATADGDRAIVFDIDGTLTPDVYAVNTARDGAADTVNRASDAGYLVIYLTARVTLLQSAIPGWLADNGFPYGPIHVTESAEDRDDHAAFKLRVLNEYRDHGWTLVAAFGDSSTDFEAYAESGIDPDMIFALQRRGDDACQPGPWVACFASWSEAAVAIDAALQPPAGR